MNHNFFKLITWHFKNVKFSKMITRISTFRSIKFLLKFNYHFQLFKPLSYMEIQIFKVPTPQGRENGAPDDSPANREKPNFKFVYETASKVTKMHAVAWDMSQEATRVLQTLSTFT